MKSDGFLLQALLSVPAAGYAAIQKTREKAFAWGLLKSRSAPIPVISVGNLLLGGSGKTPFVIALAAMLKKRGRKPAIVSRGYLGSNRKDFVVVGEGVGGPPLLNPSICGDEPYLIAQRLPDVPVLIGRKRIHPATAASELFHCDLVLLDDGFQHLPLKRDVDIVLVAGSEDRMFPLGKLRESVSALRRAHVVVLVGIDSMPPSLSHYAEHAEIFRCRPVPAGFVTCGKPQPDISGCPEKPVVLCSAIANPERFRKTVEALGCSVLDHVVFPDHHVISDGEIRSLAAAAPGHPIVVTEKDWVKLPDWFKKTRGVMALRIEIIVDDPDGLLSSLDRLMEKRDRSSGDEV
ncbi:MAG TPA: tetraacyldisaccharide 4'-kinase [Desulfomonilaceae bacterium]|nr:tetraacyldisaccharide 4'-kinase [Desulfomonilaceae bacterium]